MNRHPAVKLTGKEQEVIDVLLLSEIPLSATDIIERDKDLKLNTVLSVLRTLLKVGLIEVDNVGFSGNVLCRSYRPSVQAFRYSEKQFKNQYQHLRRYETMPSIISTLIGEEDEIDDGVIGELESIVVRLREGQRREGGLE